MAQIEVEDFGASLAEEIEQVAQALRSTRLNNSALVVLIRNYNTRLKKSDIEDVLRAISSLDLMYIKR